MDNISDKLKQVALITFSVLLALKIKEWADKIRLMPPTPEKTK